MLLELLFGAYRGLFYLAPVLLLAPWGLACELRGWPPAPKSMVDGTWPVRHVACVCLAVVGFYLALNAGYYMWDGGAAIGPRHCVPMLPFLALALAPAIRAVPWAVVGLALISGALTLLLAAAAPEAPRFGDSLQGHAWPRIWATDTGYAGPANLGRMLGLPGPLSLVPLLLVLAWCYAQARPPPARARVTAARPIHGPIVASRIGGVSLARPTRSCASDGRGHAGGLR